MSVADQPFPELRVAILLVFQALAFQPWEYLLERSTEKKQRREGRKIRDNTNFGRLPTVRDVFGDLYYVQLKTYCSEGPFYVRAQAQVAIEGES